MANESRELDGAFATIVFSNGTRMSGISGAGVVRQRSTQGTGLRSARLPAEFDTDYAFDRAMADLGIQEQETLELDATQFQAQADVLTLQPAVERGATPRVVLYQDESGGVSWHFATQAARKPKGGLRSSRSNTSPVFHISMRSSAVRVTLREGAPRRSLRGPITKVGRKIFKVLVLPAASMLLQDPLRWFWERVEGRFVSNAIWTVTPDNYRSGPVQALSDGSSLRGGPILLLVHGIFSSVEGMLAQLPRSAMQRWHERYQGRVIGFNHRTVSTSPEDNARFLLAELQRALPGERLTVDIVSHSRGGIVSRSLCEHVCGAAPDGSSSGGCDVRSIYFVATPNAGSPLGDADYMVEMIDSFTNCITNLPDGGVAYSIEVLLGLVTLIGHAGVRALPGIAAMGTQDSYINGLNRAAHPVDAIYGAAAADFEPQPGRENGFFIDRVADPVMNRVFTVSGKRVANDIVVPQQGVFAANGHPSFPVAAPLVYQADDGVWHSAFFAQPRTIAHIEAHFDRVAGEPAYLRLSADLDLDTPPPPARRRGRLRGGSTAQPAIVRTARMDETVVSRTPSLKFDDRIEAGHTANLSVALDLPRWDTPEAERLSLSFDGSSDEIALVAELSAPGFRIEGERHAMLSVRAQRNPASERCDFRLTALDPGGQPVTRKLEVSFWRGNHCVGSVQHHTVVLSQGGVDDSTTSIARPSVLRIPASRREAPDLIVSVSRLDRARDEFEISLRSQLQGHEYESRAFGSFDVGGKELSLYLSQALEPSFARFPTDRLSDEDFDVALAEWNSGFMILLADLGKQLWLHLPAEFRNEYLRLVSLDRPPRSICVYSDELAFPWEIVRPDGMVGGQYREYAPLGVAHVLARWRPGVSARPQPQTLRVSKIALLVPDVLDNDLPWAKEEEAQLRALLRCAHTISPLRRKHVDELLSATDVQMVHFSGHGLSGPNSDLNALELQQGEVISAMAFAGNRLGQEAHPMLYLNACSLGRSGHVLRRAGGFVGNCVDGGWSGIVAPYWPVYDPSAALFSVAFYRKLVSGRAVGEALQEIRAERPDDPTAQSYAYFGDPFARVLLE